MIMPKRIFVLFVAIVVVLLLFIVSAQADAAHTRPTCSRVVLVVPTGVHGWFGVECDESAFPVTLRYRGQPMPVAGPASVHPVRTSRGVEYWLLARSANGSGQLYNIALP